jgi:hypothetical protein
VAELEQFTLDPLVPRERFSLARRSISVAVSALTGGRPVRGGYVHFLVIRRRCQRRMVPGVTRRYWRTVGAAAG